MRLSIYLAQVIGLYLVIVNLSLLVHAQRFKKISSDFLMHPGFIVVSGCISTLLGLLILVPHHLWVAKWPVIITIIGWIVLLQGLARLFAPNAFVRFSKELLEKKGFLLLSWVWFLVGLYLVWAGFTQ